MKNRAAQALGRLARGIPKTYSHAELEARKQRLAEARAKRWPKKKKATRLKKRKKNMDVYNQVQMRKTAYVRAGTRRQTDSRKMKYRLRLVKKANGTVEWVD